MFDEYFIQLFIENYELLNYMYTYSTHKFKISLSHLNNGSHIYL